MRAKSAFLKTLPIGNYSAEYIAMFGGFYFNMDMHPELREKNGNLIMAHYHAEMRLAWFDTLERKEPFDLLVIVENVLESSRREIHKLEHAKALKGEEI